MIKAENIYKSWSETHSIMQNLCIEIPTGSKCCIIGMSGSGKSVLTKLILGLEKADKGEIWIDGQNIKGFLEKDWRRILTDFGVVFQGAALFDSLTILENVGIKLYEERTFSAKIIQEKVVESLEKVGLSTEILHKLPAQLSGGMRKRVGIARAIIHHPKYLIYDEPTTGLDPISSDLIDELIFETAQEKDRTTIVITHDLASVHKIATQVAMLHEKRIYFSGSPKEFFTSQDKEIVNFLRRSRTINE